MIVDSSALLAVLLREPDREQYLTAIVNADPRRMSVANWFETAMVVDGRRDPATSGRFDDFIRTAQIELVPVTVDQAKTARQAWRDFGRGNHAAALNFGDCFAYALSKSSGEPLLFKGNDFPRTDIEPALKP